jgi:hypothetical protein
MKRRVTADSQKEKRKYIFGQNNGRTKKITNRICVGLSSMTVRVKEL